MKEVQVEVIDLANQKSNAQQTSLLIENSQYGQCCAFVTDEEDLNQDAE